MDTLVPGAGRVRMAARFAALVAATALLVVGAGACRGPGRDAAAAAGGGRVGDKLADLKLVALDGGVHTLESLRGKVVVVDFWDTWCGPCLRAMPHLKELSGAHDGQVVVIAVAIGQEGEAKVREVIKRLELPFPVAMLAAQGDLAASFGDIEALPTTFLVDAEGVIRQRWVGAQAAATYDGAVKKLLGS